VNGGSFLPPTFLTKGLIMKISIEQASDILSMEPDELLMEVQSVDTVTPHFVAPSDMIYNDDGTVQFVDGDPDPTWEFDMTEILAHKKVLDEKRQAEGAKKLSQAVKTALDLED